MATDKDAPVIGIDLRSYACVGVWHHGCVEIIANGYGNRRTPSYVAFTPDELLVGEDAENQIDENPTNTIFGMKHLIGRRFSDPTLQNYIKLWPFKVVPDANDKPKVVVKYKGVEKQFFPEQLSAMILQKMKEVAEIFLDCSVQNAVITVPAYFNDSQRQAMKDACEIAGLKVLRIMDEPTAAAVAYAFDKLNSYFRKEKNILVFDLGGSMLNVSVLNIKKGVFKVLATAVDTHLGGNDFDNRLLNHFLNEIKREHKMDIRDNPRSFRRLLSACERAKRTLSEAVSTTVEVPSLYKGIDFSSNINRAQFEEINVDLLKKCMGLVTKCLKDAHMEKTVIDIVMLVGGSTRIPIVQQMLQETFGAKKLCKNIGPDEVVAYGAAIQAAKLSGHCHGKVLDRVVVDIMPLSPGRQYIHQEECAIGIDFGTTNSCVAGWQGDAIKIIENEYGSCLTGSDLTFTEIGMLIGASANEQVLTNPATTIFNIKHLVGRCSDQSVLSNKRFQPFNVLRKSRAMVSVHYRGEDKNFTPEEIAAMVLLKMKDIAEAHLNSKVRNAVICVPACFSDSQRKAIKDAGIIAGLNVMQLLNEPTAAAIAYFCVGKDSSGEKKTFLIFDLGGGNLDVSILIISANIIKVLAAVGDTNVGGKDFDDNMVSHFVNKIMKENERNISNKPRSLTRLRAACEKAKRTLSQHTHTTIAIDALDDGIDFHTTITRRTFEELNMGLFIRCIECVKDCLDEAKLDKSCIDEVVLVGGSTKIPKIQQLLQEFFAGKQLCKRGDHSETVAYGAAVQAAILCGSKNNEQFCGLEVQDVTSSSLWLDCNGGAMNLLIPKNNPIPTKKDLFFSTLDDLKTITLEVHECELASSIVFILSDITPKQRGNSKINVSFEVDHNGILNLTAKETSSTEGNEIVIRKENGGLTIEEIQKMMEAAACHKAEYEENKARAAALNSLENFAYEMKAIARDAGGSASSKKLVNEAVDNCIAWMETNYYATIDEISSWKKQLEDVKSQIVYLGANASI